MTDDYEAWTEDSKYGLRIPSAVLERMLTLCDNAQGVETGGILVGYYCNSHHCALVTDCSKAPQDSAAGVSHFYRGVNGLKTWLKRLWRHQDKRYYLGEWHFHPNVDPIPSRTDSEQMKKIASSKLYHCPEPILFIIGGDSCSGWAYQSVVYVHQTGEILLNVKNPDNGS
ncbi:Mov34/MPN/PAD-1 family protein [Planctomycetota bacterium]